MTLENWANNSWLVRLESDRKEIEGLFAVADGHLRDYEKSVASEMSSDAQLHFAYGRFELRRRPHCAPKDIVSFAEIMNT
jgi:hypothetical protein